MGLNNQSRDWIIFSGEQGLELPNSGGRLPQRRRSDCGGQLEQECLTSSLPSPLPCNVQKMSIKSFFNQSILFQAQLQLSEAS
jgi:hypothetical protein